MMLHSVVGRLLHISEDYAASILMAEGEAAHQTIQNHTQKRCNLHSHIHYTPELQDKLHACFECS
jgi:hypothetical protein